MALDEERVDERDRQRAGHQRTPVVDVASDELGDHADRHVFVSLDDMKVSATMN
jgi:hypothetical protein